MTVCKTTLSIATLRAKLRYAFHLSSNYAECLEAKCHYPKSRLVYCRCTECRRSPSRATVIKKIIIFFRKKLEKLVILHLDKF
jgi:hypothetical protein